MVRGEWLTLLASAAARLEIHERMTVLIAAPFGFAALSGSGGYGLLLGFCILLFVEECGVPMPFAPGDLVLVFSGITVVNSHLNPAVGVVAVAASVTVGAFSGREFFDRAGAPLVYRLAGFLRLRGALERVAAALRRRGWLGVLIGRLTPGLRVHTTEAAGLIGMPRRTFAAGLAPAVLIYVGVFMGLGLWLGPAASSAIHDYTPKPGPLLVVIAAIIGLVVTIRWLVGLSLRNRGALVGTR